MKEVELVNKVKHLLVKAKMPRHLNRFGPKKYRLFEHVFFLFVKAKFRLSYRRCVEALKSLGFKCASKSTLAYQAKKIPSKLWMALLKVTSSTSAVELGAIDSTGFSGSNPSWHYVKRINGVGVKRYFKVSALVDVKTRRFLSLKIRSKPRHDVLDVKSLIQNTVRVPRIVLLDKGYDAEWIHKYFSSLGSWSIAPTKKNIVRGFHRKKLAKEFPQKIYNQRSLVESLFGAVKRKYGSSVSSKKHSSATAELYCKVILHNIFLFLTKRFRTEPR